MNFAIIGGDDRSVRLVRLLRDDGHAVRHFALERALPDGASSAAEAARDADCAVLPLPAVRDGVLNAPYAAQRHTLPAVLRGLRPATPLCAGKADAALREDCARLGLPLYDYFRREDFTLRNAELTAEGAAALLAKRRALAGSRVLVAGFGRIGGRLAARLAAAGAEVTVAARSPAALAAAEKLGCRTVALAQAAAPGYDFVVNTVPAVVFGAEEIAAFGSAALIELASPPYGFDLAAAGGAVTLCAGLPGTYAPEAAAAAVRGAIYAIMEERNLETAADRAGADRLLLHL